MPVQKSNNSCSIMMETKRITAEQVFLGLLTVLLVLESVSFFIYPVAAFDSASQLNWLDQFPALVRSGIFYPHWLPRANWGFGSPSFYFYPPLTFWFATPLSFLSPSPYFLFQSVAAITTILSGIACYYFLRVHASKRISLIGSLIYISLPYRFVDLYLRNALGEHIAFIWFPLILLSIEWCLDSKITGRRATFRIITLSAFAWFGILLTNIPSSVIAIYFSMMFCFLRIRKLRTFWNLIPAFGGALLGALMSAAYLLPVEEISNTINLAHLWDVDNSPYAIIHALAKQEHLTYFSALWLTLATGVWIFVSLFRSYRKENDLVRKKQRFVWTAIVFFCVVIQIPYLLMPLWNALPLFSFIQFTWRWNIVIVIATVVYYVFDSAHNHRTINLWIFSGIFLCTIGFGLIYFFSNGGFSWQYVHSPVEKAEDYRQQNLLNAHLRQPRLEDSKNIPLVSFAQENIDGRKLSITDSSDEHIQFTASNISQTDEVIFHRLYFPSWKLHTISGEEIPVYSDSIGRINAMLPTGDHTYILQIETMKSEIIGKYISYITIAIFILLLFVTIFWRNPKAS